ncbi:uncharacterized protein BJ212DRAFT_1325680 [Suillus subaureus]|uniref:F-box domain-containing protein n=1 Tax=Suillus subaureus TaxID=48587 RepID=A0A9P7EKG8_9AGAM|nr:uncharacterized protein BJ212DRAFT_1325680 [Suillus subaureus]KAG1823632.1 hypothetical protein BJ212DRAFT_1325680 [Suillus subaureus]
MEAEYPPNSDDPQCETYLHQEAHIGQEESDVPPSSSLPASTRCLIVISELRLKIFQLVHDTFTGVSKNNNKTLLALALTCKLFTGPALDLLWQDLRGLAPLIRCLPQSLWKVTGKLELQRTMTFDDWSIFCKYNHRVRSLNTAVYETVRLPLDIEIWRALSYPPFSLPLLPNLTSLTWGEYNNETFPYVYLFVTPKLMTLDMVRMGPGTSTFGPSEQSMLSCISMLCPSISHFRFGFYGKDTSTTLQSWSHLKSVKTEQISEAAILHLSKLPLLRVLDFKLPSIPMSANTQKLLQRSVFCAIEELGVECEESLALLDAFFEKLCIAPKAISCVVTDGVDSIPALPGLISRLSNACAHSSLEQVRLSISDLAVDPDASIGAASFQPLFAFRNLRRLNVEADCNVRLNDTVLLQMAKAWPLLERLFFRPYCHLSHDVTPHAFVSLLQHCPCLVSVSVFINWSTIDGREISPVIPYQGFAHKALSEASFGSPRIRHPTRIAAFISAIALNVESIEAWDPDYYDVHPGFEKYSTRWKLVDHLVKSFSMVREQERRTKLNGDAGDEEFRGSYDHYGVVQPAQETENGEATVGDDHGESSGEDSGSGYEYVPYEEQVTPEEE